MNYTRHTLLAAAALALATARAAYTISGTDSLAVGNLAGKDAQANRTVVIGTGAGAYMQGGDSNVFIGAASGLRAVNVKSSAGIGHYAFRCTTNLTGCVGIGDLAFAGQSGISDATWINGHFFARGGTFWIKPNRDTPDYDAPIYYNAGSLYLNAGRIITRDGTTIGGAAGAADGFDWYVSDEIGDDFNDGKTAGTAFKTLDRAYEAAQAHEAVGVLPGSYAYPTNYARYVNANDLGALKPVRMVAASGPDKTFITADRPSGNPGYVIGCFSSTWSIFEGFTFTRASLSTKLYKDAHMATYFKNCVFTDMVITNGNHSGTFEVCILEGCRIDGIRLAGDRGYGQSSNQRYNPHVFGDCIVRDCVIGFANVAPSSNLGLSVQSSFEDVFLTCDTVQAVEYYPTTVGSKMKVAPGFDNCTINIATNLHPAGNYDGNFDGYVLFRNSLVGIDGSTEGAENCIVTNSAALAEAIDPDTLRPGDDFFDWYFYGYKSRLERLTKDAIVRQVVRELGLTASGSTSGDSGTSSGLGGMTVTTDEDDDGDASETSGTDGAADAADAFAAGRTLALPVSPGDTE